MRIRMLQAKIHRAVVTEANLNYEGSITLPPDLLAATGMREYQAVQVWDLTSGARFETYIIRGRRAGKICVNGAAARLVQPGDQVIIAAFADLESSEIERFTPRIVFVDEGNRIREIRPEADAAAAA